MNTFRTQTFVATGVLCTTILMTKCFETYETNLNHLQASVSCIT